MEIEADGAVVALRGDFDVRSTWQARHAIYARLDEHDGDVIVDLSAVTSIDVTAARVLAVATRLAARDGRHLVLRGCSPAVRRLLHISRLARVVEVERGVASA